MKRKVFGEGQLRQKSSSEYNAGEDPTALTSFVPSDLGGIILPIDSIASNGTAHSLLLQHTTRRQTVYIWGVAEIDEN